MVEETTFLKQDFKQKENKLLADFLNMKSLKEKVEDRAQPTADPLALLSNVSNTQHDLPSSSTSSITPLTPPHANSTDDLIENLTSTLALLTQSYRTFLPQTNNQLRTSSNPRNQATVQDGRVVVQNVQGRPNRGQGMNPWGGNAAGYWEAQNRVGNVNQGQARPGHIARNCTQPKRPHNSEYFKDKMLLMQAQENGIALDVEQLLFLADVDEAPIAQTMFMANLSSADPITDEAGPSYDSDILSEVIPFFQTIKDNFEGIQKALTKEVKQMKDVFEELEAEVVECAVDRKHDAIDRKNLLIANDNLIAECLSKEVFSVATKFELNVVRFAEMHVANTSVEARCLALEAKLATLRDKSHQENQGELIKHFSKLEVDHLNLQLKYQNLKDSIGNHPQHQIKILPILIPSFNWQNASFPSGKRQRYPPIEKQLSELQVTSSDTEPQNDLFRAENDKVKQHYKQLYDSIKITRAKHIEQVTKLIAKNVTLKTSVSKAKVQPSVLTRTNHAVDVELIVLRLRNNRDAHLDYLRHLKESVEIIRDIVEEAKVVRPLDRSIVSACRYTQHSQELLDKKQVTATKPSDRQDSNKNKHVVTQKIQKTNVPVPHSTGVKRCPKASGSQPKSNHKTNRISLAKGANTLPVEDLPRKTSLILEPRIVLIQVVVQIVLWYLDSGCSKHMTGDRSRLLNFVKKFIGTVRFGNDHFGAIMGYGDYVVGENIISKVYYVEGLGHNLFSIGQFCDFDLEVVFRKHSCYVRDTDGIDLIKGSRGSNLYTISVEDMMKSSPICLLSKASKNKSWLWHRRLNHLNFGTINDLARKDLVRGLPRLKFEKDHLCSACQLGKSKKHTHKPKAKNTNLEVLNTLHMDLCGPMRVQTINGKKYILVIVDDYSRFTWVKFLRSKDETLDVVIKFITQIQVGLNKTVRYIRTDNGTEFVNHTMTEYYVRIGIFHQKTVPRTPQQNGVVERRNPTLVAAARTMLIFSKALMFLWAEAVATACYTQNRSLIHTRHHKNPYELVYNKKPDLTFFRVFGALCYPTNDIKDLGKLQPTADTGIFVGYAPS
nr:retrovirus-related Pol polyprotein from transposon TNT 1-94 [Tanacetum cinerariifolium]